MKPKKFYFYLKNLILYKNIQKLEEKEKLKEKYHVNSIVERDHKKSLSVNYVKKVTKNPINIIY